MLDGTGPYSGFAILFWLIGLVGFLTIWMSADGLDWWLNVHSVQGREQDGLVYYSVNGTNYSANDPGTFAGGAPHPRTVYYLASQPGDGTVNNTPTQILDWGLTVGPGAIGLVLFVIGFAKRRQRSRREANADGRGSFGQGIPPETIRALMKRDGTPNT